ncbi:MAG TPA: L,D-transpeptidase family protein, partial [Thermoanaerobaculia bacterium]|nr:L,D-transpeptidase family protein [Thermoanaerobaculia bacterium]
DGRPGEGDLLQTDRLLSQTFARLVLHMAAGRVDPGEAGSPWPLRRPRPDLALALHRALYGGGGVEAAIEAARPAHPEYRKLREALARYREIERRGGWPAVPDGPVLRPPEEGARSSGERAPVDTPERLRLAALAARLAAEGDDLPPGPAPTAYDHALADAVRRFQERTGLEVDGAVGPRTLAALNTPAGHRVRQLELNLERWRWMPAELPERRVEVHLPAFRLHLIDDGRTASTLKIVVGKPRSATPVFRDVFTHAVINPYWNVPPGITAREILPQARRDPSYLSRNNYQVLDGGRIRQRPGPGNALGRVKLVLGSQSLIYLHDTPEKHLFARAERAFSHGCIRVERPLELAEWLLRGDPDWSPDRLRAEVARGRHAWVPLPEEVPVYVLYFTAWTGEDGRAHFRPDVYGYDRALHRALLSTSPEPSEALVAASPQGSPLPERTLQ